VTLADYGSGHDLANNCTYMLKAFCQINLVASAVLNNEQQAHLKKADESIAALKSRYTALIK
tara:strand:- start:679 stop:864 length:186 start_codon:yes stop_codon:yes gene_type:complete